MEYAPCPASVREARAEVRRRLEAWGLADVDELVDTAELLVSELATNVVRHLVSSPYRLTVFAAHGVLRCEVTAEALGEQNGRGLFLVAALALRWGCHQDGTGRTVWFELGTCASDGCGSREP